jgi:hypothetical protein
LTVYDGIQWGCQIPRSGRIRSKQALPKDDGIACYSQS